MIVIFFSFLNFGVIDIGLSSFCSSTEVYNQIRQNKCNAEKFQFLYQMVNTVFLSPEEPLSSTCSAKKYG